MEFLLLLLLLLFPILLLPAVQAKRRWKLPPGPPTLPLVGNFHHLDGTPLHRYFWRLSHTYGPLLHLKLGSRHVIVANTSQTAEEILKTRDLDFCSRPALLALRKLSYGGFDMAFAPYGDYWREMRKLCVLHLLSSARVKSFLPIREDEVSRMVMKISRQASHSDNIINLSDEIIFLMSTIICRIAFGKRYEHGSLERKEFSRNILEFHLTLSGFYWTDYFPWLGWVDKLTGKIDHLDRVFGTWDSFYQQLINEHQHPDPTKSMDGDVLDILMHSRDEKSRLVHIPLDHIKAVLMNVYFASADTLATVTIWGMTALIKNPEAMKAAQAEIRAISTLSGKKRMVEEEDIAAARLPYYNATIKEILRMYCPIPLLLARETIKNCTIKGFDVPAKSIVYVNAWAISRDPELWHNPDEFMPERFLGEEGKLSADMKATDFTFIPFGAGRRGCPGITMALATLEIVLANLLYAFDWKLPNGMQKEDVDDDALLGITLHRKIPLQLVAKSYVHDS